MVIYSIKDLEHLAGVKAHTIRIWEKRYSIVTPKRTETNIRYYLETDLQHILNVALLNNHGHKISHIAKMPKEEIAKRVAEISDFDDGLEDRVDCLTMSLMELNEFKFNRIIEANINQLGFERSMEEVIFPLLDKVGQLWMSGCIKPVHELFVSEIIKRKIIKAIDEIPINTDITVPSFLIFLPKNENSDLSLLYLHFMLKKDGLRVTNIGKGITKEMIIETCDIIDPDYLVLFANESFEGNKLELYLNDLCKNINNTSVLLTGYQTIEQKIKSSRKVKVLSSLEQILTYCSKQLVK
ncbi:MerR family transcriptional regulator [Portibacter lacus]|uniref:MerR family transcriptional regulator n=1 Tax=Portibacter lacus TaxID=1099794 RepID=A0AA37SU67_9BACT|nr:MerR family transcriptional regulator [Portibacter lacus]GLR19719.1 MerR family transcriptional regulator [Portibacter lacus]